MSDWIVPLEDWFSQPTAIEPGIYFIILINLTHFFNILFHLTLFLNWSTVCKPPVFIIAAEVCMDTSEPSDSQLVEMLDSFEGNSTFTSLFCFSLKLVCLDYTALNR